MDSKVPAASEQPKENRVLRIEMNFDTKVASFIGTGFTTDALFRQLCVTVLTELYVRWVNNELK